MEDSDFKKAINKIIDEIKNLSLIPADTNPSDRLKDVKIQLLELYSSSVKEKQENYGRQDDVESSEAKLHKAIYRISESAFTTSDINDLYRKVHKIIEDLVPAENFFISILDREKKVISFPYFIDKFDPKPDPINISSDEFGQGLTQYVIKMGKTLFLNSDNVSKLLKNSDFNLSGAVPKEWLGVPLKNFNNEIVGVVVVQIYEEGIHFTKENKDFLEFVSLQIGNAIERTRQKAELDSKNILLDTIIESLPLVLYIFDLKEERNIYISSNITFIGLGYTPDEVINMSSNVFEKLTHPDDLEKIYAHLEYIKKNPDKSPFTYEFRMKNKKGDWNWLRVKEAVYKYDKDGAPLQMLGTAEDITLQKQFELALKESEARYKRISELTSDFAFSLKVTKDHRLLAEWSTEAMKRETGYAFNDVFADGNSWSEFIHPEDHKLMFQILRRMISNITDISEYRVLTKSGEIIWVQTYSKPVWDEKEKRVVRVVGASQDITERKIAEEKIKAFNQELRILNSNKDKFFSIIAHDLKSPFSALLGYTEMMMQDYDSMSDDEKKNTIAQVRNVVSNVYNLLENLLNWSRIQTGRLKYTPEKIDVELLVEKTISLFNETALKKTINFKFNPVGKIFAYADENMVYTVLRNIVSNAIKFSNKNDEIRIVCSVSNERVEILVSDDGVGILDEDIKKIFNIGVHHSTYGTDKEAGSGLGLLLSKELIEMNKGELEIKSELNYGTEIKIILPASN